MKKILSLLLALIMIMSLAVSASAASITITPNLPADGSTSGETYTAYKIFDATFENVEGNAAIEAVSYTIDEDSPFYETISESGYFTLTKINDSNVFNVAKNDSFTSEKAATLAASLKAVIDADSTITGIVSNNSNTIEVTVKGYYLITSTLGSKMIVDTLGDITIETKNEYPSLTKSADKSTAAFGEEIIYTVNVTIPETANAAIVVHDTMTNLTYVADSVSAKVGDTAVDVTAASAASCCGIEFTLSETVVKAHLGETVAITYKATVNANATTATNTAKLTYSAFTSKEAVVSAANYKFDVFKYTGSTDAPTGLAGAGFVLARTVEDKSEGAAEGATKLEYYVLNNGIVSWVESIGGATEYVTTADNNYTITFNGLANGTYTLIENTVPAGYNKANDQTITIDGANAAQVNVLNQTGSELPSTGGMGTTMFYIIGSLLMGGAAILMVTKKKMS